ncbi:C40 family peptidase [Dyella telluris]|uniref:C40 family peptidase n=1 Tax=Dyella telluris TaxID=2763498 RepID=A0A7G8Q183_9GAMM|nr:C40 family peptidase [Dyella telluris]QNK00541.1 C40 family peptidase [Dyella telluris]
MRPQFAVPADHRLGSWRTARHALLVSILLMLAACSSGNRRPEPTYKDSRSSLANLPARAPAGATGTANDVLFRAIALVGTPYRWGGNTPDGGFDCSGLVDYIYRNAAGLNLPHSSREMSQMDGARVRQMTDLVSGDLVFFGGTTGVSHVGVYVGKGRFVHAPNSGGTVRLDDIDGPYWRDHFAFGKRLLD